MKGTIAIIPARGGSKRIPGKNVKPFLGKPIIAYSIEVALESGLFDLVMVSTDDSNIAEEAIRYGATVPFLRSKLNADDFATTSDVLAEVLNRFQQDGLNFKYACCIYPCAPFVTKDILNAALLKLDKEHFNCVLPVLPFGFPIWRALKINDDQKLAMIWPENTSKRTQDLPTAFHDAGQFYFFEVPHFMRNCDLWNGNVGGIAIDEMHAQDIDTESDWKIAEVKYQIMQRQ